MLCNEREDSAVKAEQVEEKLEDSEEFAEKDERLEMIVVTSESSELDE